MKFCNKTKVEYLGLSGTPTTTDLISIEDIASFHGKEFASKWLEFANNISTTIYNNKKYYYYYDYKNIAITTDMWLNFN